MATIYGNSGSTKYLLNGISDINGKKLTTLDEINYFNNNYEAIQAQAEVEINKQKEAMISALSVEESRLGQELQNGIAKRTVEVDKQINELKTRASAAKIFHGKIYYQICYLIESSLRSAHINEPFNGLNYQLKKCKIVKLH